MIPVTCKITGLLVFFALSAQMMFSFPAISVRPSTASQPVAFRQFIHKQGFAEWRGWKVIRIDVSNCHVAGSLLLRCSILYRRVRRCLDESLSEYDYATTKTGACFAEASSAVQSVFNHGGRATEVCRFVDKMWSVRTRIMNRARWVCARRSWAEFRFCISSLNVGLQADHLPHVFFRLMQSFSVRIPKLGGTANLSINFGPHRLSHWRYPARTVHVITISQAHQLA